jgi:hypothetical protein
MRIVEASELSSRAQPIDDRALLEWSQLDLPYHLIQWARHAAET